MIKSQTMREQAQTKNRQRERIAKVDPPSKPVIFEEWKDTIDRHFPDLVFPAEVGLSVIAQILINDISNPFALVFTDVPSSGKTITINLFAGIEEITYASDKFTPASFVSHAANVKKEKLAEIDLLPRIQYKTLLIRDLSTLFSKRDDDLNESLGILTRVLDGEGLNIDTGAHGQRTYEGVYLFMILAASTHVAPRVWKMMGNLGSRLFFLSMRSRVKSDDELIDQITSPQTCKEKELACRAATRDLLHTLWSRHPDGVNWDRVNDPRECKIVIAKCARLLARLRGVINISWEQVVGGKEVFGFTQPVIENPDRINQLLYNVCRAHALISGEKQITLSDLRIVIEVAMNSVQITRSKLMHAICANGESMKTSEVMSTIECSRTTALKEMETLAVLGICKIESEQTGKVGEPEKKISLKEEFMWFAGQECAQLRQDNSCADPNDTKKE